MDGLIACPPQKPHVAVALAFLIIKKTNNPATKNSDHGEIFDCILYYGE